MDVDGVLTNGEIVYSDAGDEMKVFNILDGQGITIAHHGGLMTAIITGRAAAVVQRRASELGITHVYQGCRDKGAAIRRLMAELGLKREEVAFVGDDINDIPAFREVGLKIAVSSASADLKAQADYVTHERGGNGAVREVVELILQSQEKWTAAVERFLLDLQQSECQT
jgi:3-deoxy-D-manno-octulosonate 8-phosphate phosphatase (KDO 8-P phosphatase)